MKEQIFFDFDAIEIPASWVELWLRDVDSRGNCDGLMTLEDEEMEDITKEVEANGNRIYLLRDGERFAVLQKTENDWHAWIIKDGFAVEKLSLLGLVELVLQPNVLNHGTANGK